MVSNPSHTEHANFGWFWVFFFGYKMQDLYIECSPGDKQQLPEHYAELRGAKARERFCVCCFERSLSPLP